MVLGVQLRGGSGGGGKVGGGGGGMPTIIYYNFRKIFHDNNIQSSAELEGGGNII